MNVRDVGIKEVHCAKPDSNLSEIASMMKRHNIGIIPVCEEGDKLIGVITDRDIVITCIAADMDAEACKAREFMSANPVTASADMDIEDAARIMGKEQIHRLPVVEKDNRLVGIVSLGDIAMALAGNESLVAQTLRKISTPSKAAPVC